MGSSLKKTGKRQWAKVWHTLLTDPCYQGLSLEQQARYINLLIFVSAHGKKGSLRIDSPARQLLFTLQCSDFNHLKEVIKWLPNLKIKESKSNGDFIVTFENWYKYQIDDSTERVRKFRQNVTVQEKEKEQEEEEDKNKRKKYGEYQKVLLTDNQYDKLIKDFGETRTKALIKMLDEGVEMKGYKYKNFNLAIRKWEKNDGQGNFGKGSTGQAKSSQDYDSVVK